MKPNNRLHRADADKKLIDGVQQFLSQNASLTVGSQKLTPVDIVKLLQGRVDSGQAVLKAEAAHVAAVKAERDERAKTTRFVAALRRCVVGMFSESPDTLAVFGLTVPKAGKRTTKGKVAAVELAAATRTARHTMGSRQKAEIKGVLPTPPTPPPHPPVTPPAPVSPLSAATPVMLVTPVVTPAPIPHA